MATTYKELKRGGRLYWWRIIGHRGGRTYEVSEPMETPGRGRAIVRRNIGFWVVDEQKLLNELVGSLNAE